MLEKPKLPDESITACLKETFGLQVTRLAFLPLGADVNTAVYRLETGAGKAYFVKLRSGAFDETSVSLPKFLYDQGIWQIIPPLPARTGRLWAELEAFKMIVYPFVEGRDGYAVNLTEQHWFELGAALKRLHSLQAPAALVKNVQRESYSHQFRERVIAFLGRLEPGLYSDPAAVEMAGLLQANRRVVLDLVRRAGWLAQALAAQPPPYVLCHSDLHAGNVLIDAQGTLHIVDWDNPILAPKERDLMYAGGGQGFGGRTPQEEVTLFYRGYGPTQVDTAALAYYRYERIVQDIAAYSEQLLLTEDGGEDRQRSLGFAKSNFLPGGTLEIAYQSDQTHLGCRSFDQ